MGRDGVTSMITAPPADGKGCTEGPHRDGPSGKMSSGASALAGGFHRQLAGAALAEAPPFMEARHGGPAGALRESLDGASPLTQEEVVAGLFEAFSRRDLSNMLAWMHPQVVFQPVTATVTQAGEPYRGHEGIRRYAADVQMHWEELTIRTKQIRAAGCAVVAIGLVSGRGQGGAFEDAPTTWVVKFKDELVAHIQIFSDERNAVNALVADGNCALAVADD